MKKIMSLILALTMVLSLAVSSAAAVEISEGPVEISVDGTMIRIGGEEHSLMPRYVSYELLDVTKNANQALNTTFRCLSQYGNKCMVTVENNCGSDLLVQMCDGQYAAIVPGYGNESIPIETTDGSPLQITIDIQVEALGNPSGTYRVTAYQYNA